MTSLSVGLLIYDILTHDAGVAAIAGTTKVFPVVAEDGAALPYVCYRRGSMSSESTKSLAGADTCTMEVMCYAASYSGSISLAEAVRKALDNAQGTYQSGSGATLQILTARSIRLIDSEEIWEDDAYGQMLTFLVRIN